MRKLLCTAMAVMVAVAAMAVGVQRNSKAPVYKLHAENAGKLMRKPANTLATAFPKFNVGDLRKAPALKADGTPTLWANFIMGYEDIEDPGIYSFVLDNQFPMGNKIIACSDIQATSFASATASVVGGGKVYVSSWYGSASIYDLATGECLMSSGTDAISNIFYSACYDEESDLVYGAFFNNDATALLWCSYDMNTFTKSVIADVSAYGIIGCDFDAQGNVWFIGSDGTFYKTTKDFRNVETIGSLGITPACEYSNGGMCIDRDTNVLYWAFDVVDTAEDGNEYLFPYMASINLNNYTAATYQSNFLFGGMYMPVDIIQDMTVPSAPATVTLTRNGNNAVIAWSAVTTNLAGERITGVTYNVIDKKDNTEVATGVTGTSYTINNLNHGGIEMRQFAVVAVHDGKTSKATVSNKVAFGDAYSLPHTFPVDPDVDVDQFTIIDANRDGTTWFYEERGNYQVFTIVASETEPKDDWLITPPVAVKANKSVRMKYIARPVATNYPETMEIKAGKGATVNDMTIDVQQSTVYTDTKYTVYDLSFVVPEDGNYNIGFHAISPANHYEFCIDDIVLEEGAAIDAPNRVENLKLIPALEGQHECDVEFTAPRTTVSGAALNDFKINVFCGDRLVMTFDECEPGEELGFSDMNVPNGFNTYSVVAVNAAGTPSDTIKAQAYVGYGTPRVAMGCKLRVVDGNLVASWNTPLTDGINGYVDPARVSHNIYIRRGDGEYVKFRTSEPGSPSVIVQSNVDDLEDQAMLSVYVEAVDVENNLVSGKRVETNKCLYGKPYDMPYVDDLNTSPYEWYVIEKAVGSSTEGWQYGMEDGEGVLYVKCDYPTGEAVVNTGKIAINGAKNTTLVFDQYLGEMVYNDRLDVQVGAGNIEQFTTVASYVRDATPEDKWITHAIDLSAFADAEWISIQFHAQGAPQGQAKREHQMIRNVRIMDAVDGDMALKVSDVGNQGKLPYSGSCVIKVKVTNNGSVKASAGSYSVILKNDATGKTAYAAETPEIAPLSTKEVKLIYTSAGASELEEINLTAEVVNDGDPVAANNTDAVKLTLEKPEIPTVDNLAATEDDGQVHLTWTIPESTIQQVEQGFETYSAFTVGDEVLADEGYTIYFNPQTTKQCGSGKYDHAGEAIGWLIFDNKKAGFGGSGAYAPHSGAQSLVAFDGAEAMDTWLITPELSGNEQTISFWTGCLSGNWGAEEFNVLYSTTGTDKADFIKINNDVLTEKQSWSWTERKFEVPQGAKYFAIQVVSTAKMGLKIDDLTFETGKQMDVEVDGYQITVDGKVAKTVVEKETFMPMPFKTTTYGVSIVTPVGVGPETFVQFSPSALRGDVNLDGKIDVQDINCILNIMLGNEPTDTYDGRDDVNGDGRTDVIDFNIIIGLMLE